MQQAGQTPTSLENPDAPPVAALEEIRVRIARLDKKIKPVNDLARDHEASPGEISERMRRLDEEIGGEKRDLLLLLIRDYLRADSAWRAELRALVAQHHSFAWSVTVGWLSSSLSPVDYFRAELVMFSIIDRTVFGRYDHGAELSWILADARKAGVDLWPLLYEVAALSSDVDRYGWGGSTRNWLEEAAPGLDWIDWSSWQAAFTLVDSSGELVEPFDTAAARFRKRRACTEMSREQSRQVLQTSVDVMRFAKQFRHSQLGTPRPAQARREELLEQLAQLLLRECPHATYRLRAAGCRVLEDHWSGVGPQAQRAGQSGSTDSLQRSNTG